MNKISEIKVSYKPTWESDISKIESSKDVFKLLHGVYQKSTINLVETVYIILLRRNNSVIGIKKLSSGGRFSSIIEIPMILATAIKTNTHGIILSHNHPSTNLQPSDSDIKITEKLKKSCELMDLRLIDHLIITFKDKFEYLSFQDEGLL